MNIKALFFLLLSFLLTTHSYSQSEKKEHNLKEYLKNIVAGEQPKNDRVTVNYKYIKIDRSFTFVDPLIKKYKYSSEVFDKLGFDRIDKNTFRRCSDGLIVNRYGKRDGVVIIIKWYSKAVRDQTYLVYCK
jgi:hypothetical protein